MNGITKWLDRFLIASSVIPFLHHHRVWSAPLDVSDHYLICLEWAVDTSVRIYPFKFNRAWLAKSDFCDFVKECWSSWTVDLLWMT